MADGRRREAFLRAPAALRRAAAILVKQPLAGALGGSKYPMSLGDASRALGPDWNRPPELEGVEAVAVNVDISAKNAMQAVFFGRNGVVSGLSKSLLFLGVHLAAQRLSGALRRPETSRSLTGREQQMLDFAKSGLTDAKIGKLLGIATRTVRFHLRNAMRKAGAQTRSQLIAKASQRTLK